MSESRNVVDQYPMEQMLAGTPQTSVYRSTDKASGKPVAVKIISSLGSSSKAIVRQHFLRAMGAVQFLQLPPFPEILDFGFGEDDTAFMVMEWVEASPIEGLRGDSLRRILSIFVEIVDALEALAMGQVYHLNLAPGNLMLRSSANGERACILGFGTSIYLTGSHEGAMMGHSPESDAYMAPERLDPETAETTNRTLADLYSLCLILAELLDAGFESDGNGNRRVVFPRKLGGESQQISALENILSEGLRMLPSDRKISYPLLKKILSNCIGKDDPSARTRIISPEEIRNATQGSSTSLELDEGESTVILPPGTLPQDHLELGGEKFELDLPANAGNSPEAAEADTAELQVPGEFSSPTQTDAGAEVPPLPGNISEEKEDFDIGETAPNRQANISDEEEAEDELDETDPGIFDPNETNPAIDPFSPGTPPAPPAEIVPPPLPQVPAPPAETTKPQPLPQAPPATPVAATDNPPSAEMQKGAQKPLLKATAHKALPKFLWILLPAIAGLIVLLMGFLALRSCRSTHEAPPAPIVEYVPTPAPTPVPEDEGIQMNPVLQEAEALLENGDLQGARDLIEKLSPEEIDAFSEEERQNYDGIAQAAQGSQLDAAISDLEGGLAHGSIRMLNRASRAFSRLDASEYRNRRDVVAKLQRCRDILKIHAQLWKVHNSDDHQAILELSSKMISVLPKYSTSYKFRDQAAASLEKASATALAQRNFKLASEILAPISRYYSNRKGLRKRLDEIRSAEVTYQHQKEGLDAARAKGAAGQPDAALAMLKSLKLDLDSSLRAQAAELEGSLKAQLAEMDKNPPRVSLAKGVNLSYKKKKPITLRFLISDDLGVKDASILLRFSGGGGFIRKSLESRGSGSHEITITPAMHHNDDFSFYVEARDRSDHIGRLGSARQPMKVKRKRGLKALFGK